MSATSANVGELARSLATLTASQRHILSVVKASLFDPGFDGILIYPTPLTERIST